MAFDEEENDNDLTEDNYSNKYFRLIRRCESIKLDNERLINNIYRIKKLLNKYKKQKRLLINRLQKYRDDYKNVELPLFVENEERAQQTNRDSQKSLSNLKSKSSLTKSNGVANSFTSKPKKSKPINSNKNENASHGTLSGAPKKPINPYLLFCQENRSTVQEKHQLKYNTEMPHQELTKALAQNWHELSVNAKQVYYNLFNNDKVRYENEMKLYTANSSKLSGSESCDN